jgi:uncharacterized protein YfaP (DUF2135 family)
MPMYGGAMSWHGKRGRFSNGAAALDMDVATGIGGSG